MKKLIFIVMLMAVLCVNQANISHALEFPDTKNHIDN